MKQELTPVNPQNPPIPMTVEQVAALDKQWEELFTPECEPRYMEQVRAFSPEQRSALLALTQSLSTTKT